MIKITESLKGSAAVDVETGSIVLHLHETGASGSLYAFTLDAKGARRLAVLLKAAGLTADTRAPIRETGDD